MKDNTADKAAARWLKWHMYRAKVVIDGNETDLGQGSDPKTVLSWALNFVHGVAYTGVAEGYEARLIVFRVRDKKVYVSHRVVFSGTGYNLTDWYSDIQDSKQAVDTVI